MFPSMEFTETIIFSRPLPLPPPPGPLPPPPCSFPLDMFFTSRIELWSNVCRSSKLLTAAEERLILQKDAYILTASVPLGQREKEVPILLEESAWQICISSSVIRSESSGRV